MHERTRRRMIKDIKVGALAVVLLAFAPGCNNESTVTSDGVRPSMDQLHRRDLYRSPEPSPIPSPVSDPRPLSQRLKILHRVYDNL